MPTRGFYHDAIERQEPYDEETLDPDEWTRDMFAVYTDEELRTLQERADALFRNTSRAIIGNFGLGAFGDIAYVPGTQIPLPEGDSLRGGLVHGRKLYPDYVRGIFDRQLEIALKNLPLCKEAVGDRIVAIFISGTDFGSQRGAFISPETYREMYQPYHKAINDWVRQRRGRRSTTTVAR